jgi:mRNA interferase HigB
MRVIKKRTLQEFWEKNGDSKKSLEAWYAEAKAAHWQTPADIKKQYRSASILKDSRVVFNIHANKYRLIAKINYPFSFVYIRFMGTHREYDLIDAEEI